MRSYMAKKCDVPKGWHVVDATGKAPGRLATQVATVLMGKHRPTYTPHVDTGEFVVIVNAEKVRLTGRKTEDKRYYRYSGYQGGLRSKTAKEVLASGRPEDVVYLAVRKMLPKTRLGRQMIRKLKVYAGPVHPHSAQAPQPLSV